MYLCSRFQKIIVVKSFNLEKMKKLVLFAAFAAVLGFSSCTTKVKEEAKPEGTENVQPAAPAQTTTSPDSTAKATPAPDSSKVVK